MLKQIKMTKDDQMNKISTDRKSFKSRQKARFKRIMTRDSSSKKTFTLHGKRIKTPNQKRVNIQQKKIILFSKPKSRNLRKNIHNILKKKLDDNNQKYSLGLKILDQIKSDKKNPRIVIADSKVEVENFKCFTRAQSAIIPRKNRISLSHQSSSSKQKTPIVPFTKKVKFKTITVQDSKSRLKKEAAREILRTKQNIENIQTDPKSLIQKAKFSQYVSNRARPASTKNFRRSPTKVMNLNLPVENSLRIRSARNSFISKQSRTTSQSPKLKITVKHNCQYSSYQNSPKKKVVFFGRSESQNTMNAFPKLYHSIHNKIKRTFSASISMKRNDHKNVVYG